MKKVIIALVLIFSVAMAWAFCPKVSEEVSGQNKICCYKCLDGKRCITIPQI